MVADSGRSPSADPRAPAGPRRPEECAQSLSAWLRDGTRGASARLRIAARIAEALETLHERGLVHGALDPEAVTVSGDEVRLVTVGDAARPAAGYASPEILAGADPDRRSDLFSLGAIAFECLAKAPAFPGRDAGERIAATVGADADWAALPPGTPGEAVTLIRLLLSKDPRERLRDVVDARVAFQELADRAEDAPAGDGPPSNLPVPLADLIGRERDLEIVTALLGETRLVTLTGAGGCGKTRLAIDVARALRHGYPDGVWFVDLAPIRAGERVAPAVCAALGVSEALDVPHTEAIARHLGAKRMLLVLDNCEHLLSACAVLVETALRASAGLRILSTSREALRIPGERTYAVPTLDVPPEGAPGDAPETLRSAAVRLFAERAAAVDPRFRLEGRIAEDVSAICRALDGLPLAIELCAARTSVLGPEAVRARLDDRLRLLTGGGGSPTRHQTIRAAFGWSYDLLEEPERRLFRSLGLFAGGFTLEAAAAVLGDHEDEYRVLDLLTGLLDKSLIVITSSDDGGMRGRMLETLRQFAHALLAESGEEPAVEKRFLEYYVGLSERAEMEFMGPSQRAWLARMESDHENLLTALELAGRSPERNVAALRIVGAVHPFWCRHGHIRIGRRLLEAALARDRGAAPPGIRARALRGAGWHALYQGDFEAGRGRLEESRALCAEIGDRLGEARASNGLGAILAGLGDCDASRAAYEQSLAIFRALGDDRGVGSALSNLGLLALERDAYDEARGRYAEAIQWLARVGDLGNVARCHYALGITRLRTGDPPGARLSFAECLEGVRVLGEKHVGAYALEGVASLAAACGEDGKAARAWGAVESLRAAIGSHRSAREAARLAEQTDAVRGRLGPAAWDSAYAAGRKLEFDQAVGEALEWLNIGRS